MKSYLKYLLPILPALIFQTITRQPRYKPEIEWSDKSWTHNVFRFLELIFGRKVGIRAEMSTSVHFENGQKFIEVELYTIEAVFAYLETIIRELFSLKLLPFKLVSYQLSVASEKPVRVPWINFAIALDATGVSTSQTASPFTWTHTCTGSNGMLVVGGFVEGLNSQATITGVTYNSVAMTKARGDQFNFGTGNKSETSVWLLKAPTTGSALTISATVTNIDHAGGQSVSYTGANQSSTADAVNGGTGLTAGSQSVTVTTVADNCWIYALGFNSATLGATAAANQTSRGTMNPALVVSAIIRGEDTNAAQTPAGAKTIGFTFGNTTGEVGWLISAASFGPVVATTPYSWQQPMMQPFISNDIQPV